MKRRVTKKFVKIEKVGRTIATRDIRTGRLTGRKLSKTPDLTRVRRVKKSHPKFAGHIFGRVKVKKYKRRSKKGKKHKVRKYKRKRI